MPDLVVSAILVSLGLSNVLLWFKTAFLQGMCEGLIATIKGLEREREENERKMAD